MIGRKFDHARRVVVMLIDEDGRQHGFEVFDATVEWTWTGLVDSSPIGSGSVAILKAEGRFHRADRGGLALGLTISAEERRIAERQIGLPGSPPGLEGST